MKKPSKEAREATELLHEVFMAHKRNFQALAKERGLSPQQAATLLNLAPGEGTTMNAIAEFLMCDASNVTGIVDKLESRGLIVRQSAENDRRIKMLAVTEKGREMRERLCARLLEAPPALVATRPEFRRQLTDLLRTMIGDQAGATPPDPRGA